MSVAHIRPRLPLKLRLAIALAAPSFLAACSLASSGAGGPSWSLLQNKGPTTDSFVQRAPEPQQPSGPQNTVRPGIKSETATPRR